MSHHSYVQSRELAGAAEDWQFSALIMAAMRRADSWNLRRLQLAFPEIWAELEARYHAPHGLIGAEAVALE